MTKHYWSISITGWFWNGYKFVKHECLKRCNCGNSIIFRSNQDASIILPMFDYIFADIEDGVLVKIIHNIEVDEVIMSEQINLHQTKNGTIEFIKEL